MPQINVTEHIAAPPAVVWAFISDLHRVPEWVIGTKKMLSVSTAETEQGTEYRELSQVGFLTSETTWRVMTFRAPHVQMHECRSAMGNVTLTMTVEPAGNGTRIRHVTEYRLMPHVRPLGRLLEALLHRRTADDMHRSVQQAKQIIEQEYGAVERTTPQPLQVDRAVPDHSLP